MEPARSQDEIEWAFYDRLNELFAMYGITDQEYMDKILPAIPASFIFDAEVAEQHIRVYRARKR